MKTKPKKANAKPTRTQKPRRKPQKERGELDDLVDNFEGTKDQPDKPEVVKYGKTDTSIETAMEEDDD